MIFDLTNINLNIEYTNKTITNISWGTNTNILIRVITNVIGTNTNFIEFDETNVTEGSNITISVFYDPFEPLVDTQDDTEGFGNVSELLFPNKQWTFTNREEDWKKKFRLSNGVALADTNTLDAFSESSFQEYLMHKVFHTVSMTEDEAKHLSFGFEEWDTRVTVQGTVELQAGYGWSWKDESYPGSIPGITSGFNLSQKLRVNVSGKIGDRVDIMIDHSSETSDNTYEIGYKALQGDEGILKELKFGNVDLTLPTASSYIKYNASSLDSTGLKATLGIGDLTLQGVFSLVTSKKGYKKFTGKKQFVTVSMPDINYIKRKYFNLGVSNVDSSTVAAMSQVTDPLLSDHLVDGLYFHTLIQGKDFTFNAVTGDFQLLSSGGRNTAVLIYYTKDGSPWNINIADTNFIGFDNNSGTPWLYLWKPSMTYSPYTVDGWYALGYQNFDPTRGFNLNVYSAADTNSIASQQFTTSDYDINPLIGMIKFHVLNPFVGASIYTNPQDPLPTDSKYVITAQFYYPVSSYQLDFNVVTGSEQVFLNGRLLPSSEYYILDATGELFFNNASLINDNDVIEIYYEYKPFFTGSQKYGLAMRLDWKPSTLFNTGATFIYNISQRDTSAPSITSTPDSTLLGNVDMNMNVGKLLGIPDSLAAWTAKGEAAISVANKNTVGCAIVDDFESVGNVYSFSKNETRWILCAPLSNIPSFTYTNRGQLLYRNYVTPDNVLQNFGFTLSPNEIFDYSFKCGPYTTFGGHLSSALYPDVVQSSLIFDYDFTGQGPDAWVGAACSIGGVSGVDLSLYNSITIWAKLQSDDNGDGVYIDDPNASAQLMIAVGSQNEDAEGNAILEKELDPNQSGYPFYKYGDMSTVETWVGRGRLSNGDGVAQTEDLNRNGVLDTNSALVVFPSPDGTKTDLTNAVITGGEWQKIEINITSLTAEDIAALSTASSISIYVKKANGNRGRLIIDTIDFKSVTWIHKRVDNVFFDGSMAIRGEPITVFNDSNYTANRFYDPSSTVPAVQARAAVFEKLHGTMTVAQALEYNEKSLAVFYNLTNIGIDTNSTPVVGGTNAALIETFNSPFDISRYNYLHFYFFIPSHDENGDPIKTGRDTYSNERLTFAIGSDENSVYRWRIPMSSVALDTWHEVTIVLINNLEMEVDGNPISGFTYPEMLSYPSLQSISYMEVGAETTNNSEPMNQGEFWVDEIYASSSRSQVGTAYFMESAFEYKKPILKIGTMECIGPMAVQARYENKGWGFNPDDGGSAGNYNDNYNISLESSFFRDLSYKLSWSENQTGTTTNQLDVPTFNQNNAYGDTFNGTVNWKGKDWIPDLGHSYTETYSYSKNRNLWALSNNEDAVLGVINQTYSGQATFSYVQNMPVIPGLTITPEASYEDFYSLVDQSDYTNDQTNTYLTNDNTAGMEDLRKSMKTKLKLFFWKFNLGGGYERSLEQYQPVYTLEGFRQQMDDLMSESIAERYIDRLESAMQGFSYPDEPLEKQNGETYSLTVGAERPVNWFSLACNDTLTRTATGFSYDSNDILQQKSELYSLNGSTIINLIPKWGIFDSCKFDIRRKLDYTYYEPDITLDVTNVLSQLGEVYYMPFWQYNPLFNWDSGRTNSLNLVNKLPLSDFQNRNELSETYRMTIVLTEIKNFLKYFIPGQYEFYTIMDTVRNQSSYAQNTQTGITTSLPIKISELLKGFAPTNATNVGFHWDDLMLSLNYQNQVDYNARTIANSFKTSLFNNMVLTKESSFSWSYALTVSVNAVMSNLLAWENNWGFTSASVTTIPSTVLNHSGNLTYNWSIPKLKEINLWLIKINLRGSTMDNKESLTITGDNYFEGGYTFSEFQQKIIEITLDHTSSYKFTDYITGSLLVRGIVNEYADIVPIGEQIVTRFYEPGFGFQATLDVKFTF